MRLMNTNGWNDVSFKKDQYGNTVFYPWGIIGKGRVLANPATEHKVRSLVQRLNIISTFSIVLFGITVSWVLAFSIALIIVAFFQMRIISLLNGCSLSEEKLTAKETFLKLSEIHSNLMLWTLIVFSVLFVILGIWMAMTASSINNIIYGWIGIILFGVCAALFGYMLVVKNA